MFLVMNDLVVNKIELLDADSALMAINFISGLDTRAKTKEIYKKGVKYFLAYLKDKNINEVSSTDIINYKNELLKNHSVATTNIYLTAIKRFYSFLDTNYGIKNIAKDIKTIAEKKTHKKDGLTIEQVKALLANITNVRDKALIYLLLSTGTRTIEIERANVEDLEVKGNEYILRVQGKGHDKKDDYVIINKKCYDLLNEYFLSRENLKMTEPLFVATDRGHKGQRLTTRSIRRIVKNEYRKNGIVSPRITTHSLRHTAASQLVRAKADIYEVKTFLRQSNINITQIYFDEDIETDAKSKSSVLLETLFW